MRRMMILIIMMIQVTCLALQTIGGAELYRGAADIRWVVSILRILTKIIVHEYYTSHFCNYRYNVIILITMTLITNW